MSGSPQTSTSLLLADLAERYRPVLRSFFRRRVRDPSEVSDLIQEVFLRLARTRELQAIGHFEGYLFEVAANVLRDRGRYRLSRQSERHDPYEDDVHALEDFSPERVLSGRQAVGRVVLALHELPERARVAFVLHRFEGLRQPEIARRLGVSVSAVEKYVMQALAHIRLKLDESP